MLALALGETWPGAQPRSLPLQAAIAGRAAASRSWFLSCSPAPWEHWSVADGPSAAEPMALGVRWGEGEYGHVKGLI